MNEVNLQDWTASCLALIRQEGLSKTAAVDLMSRELAFQRSGISSMELFVSVTLACRQKLLAAPFQNDQGPEASGV